jgi:hypothetical protein
MDFYEAVVGGKRFLLHAEAVAAERKIASRDFAGIVGGEGAIELERVAGKFDGGFEREAVRAGDFEAEFPGVALGDERKGQERKNEEEAEVEQ